MGLGSFFPPNPDLADILGDTDFYFENFYFWDFLGSQLGPSLGPAWARLGPSLGPAWARLGPGLGPGLGPKLGPRLGPGLGRAWAQTPPPDELSDPNLTPLPTHPGIKYVARTFAATEDFFPMESG